MGDLRKLELARTIATGAEVLLLDEVFAGLTAGEIAQISELINAKRADGLTFIIVSHDLKALEPLIDRTIAMAQGAKIAEGPLDAGNTKCFGTEADTAPAGTGVHRNADQLKRTDIALKFLGRFYCRHDS